MFHQNPFAMSSATRFLLLVQSLGCLLGSVPQAIALEVPPFPSDIFAFKFESGFSPFIVKEILGGFTAQSPLVSLSQP
jgi:hypothetical protein